MRGATQMDDLNSAKDSISIHAPHAGSDDKFYVAHEDDAISIHAPHAGSDYEPYPLSCEIFVFQSTLPMRGATGMGGVDNGYHL